MPCGVTELQHAGIHVIAVHSLLCVYFVEGIVVSVSHSYVCYLKPSRHSERE